MTLIYKNIFENINIMENIIDSMEKENNIMQDILHEFIFEVDNIINQIQ